MKPKTIVHFKIYRYIADRMYVGPGGVQVTAYGADSLLVTDMEDSRMVFRYEDGQVLPYEFSTDGQLIRFHYPPGHPDYERPVSK